MPLKTVLDSLESVDDAWKPLYKEVDRKFILDIDGVDDHPTVRGLKSAHEAVKARNSELTTENAGYKTKISELPEDFDAQKWLEYKQAAEGDKTKKDKAVEDMTRLHEARITALQATHTAEIKSRDDEVVKLNGHLDKLALDHELTDLLVKSKVDQALMEGARAVVASKVKIMRTDDGARKMLVETNIGDQPLSDFMRTWAETDGQPYIARATGPGAQGGGGKDGKRMQRSEFLKLTPMQQGEIAAKAAKGEMSIVD